ncbi:short chain dehydrogenase [Mucilaginibacter sp. UR6-11]|uniref:short chain dehydrogenase n=1 Tax=Mucilaginibacter sp. UR6-11 TaxID=1435644 RepID=UPI001E468795|nr:short chain dehydrogenase [Mucilaginibacter sp. UR6-11]MCC8423525.1 short chain dehydrogenase [Mucilaginibacter sp. UR6-11]
MKIIIIGATGTIGKHVTAALAQDHEIIKAGSKSGDFNVDISSVESIEAFYKQVGKFDSLVCVSGDGHFGPLGSMKEAHFRVGINSKLMGQVNLVLIGQHYINHKGSFTLTSGSLAEDPIILGTNLSAMNGAINGFVRGAAVELENALRINAVAPDVVEESPIYFPYFPRHIPVTMNSVTQAYLRSVLGGQTGQVYKVSNH